MVTADSIVMVALTDPLLLAESLATDDEVIVCAGGARIHCTG
jgi:hypothetical protein